MLDVTTDNSRLDLVAAGFDAGIHLGEFIARDMVAVRVSPDLRAAIVGSPRYFEANPKPKSPRDLTSHRCLNFRHGTDGIYRWEFEKGRRIARRRRERSADHRRCRELVGAAVDGVGLAFTAEAHVGAHLESGALVRVLEDWCPPFSGYFLYYPSRRQQPAPLSALIETLRL